MAFTIFRIPVFSAAITGYNNNNNEDVAQKGTFESVFSFI